VDTTGHVRTSPYFRLAAYYALLGLGVWALIGQVPAIPRLLDRLREISLLSGGAGRAPELQQLAGGGAVQLSHGELALVTVLSPRGTPTPVAATLLPPPLSLMGPIPPGEIEARVARSVWNAEPEDAELIIVSKIVPGGSRDDAEYLENFWPA